MIDQYDQWLSSPYCDYDDDDGLTDEEREALIEEAAIDKYESNQPDDDGN